MKHYTSNYEIGGLAALTASITDAPAPAPAQATAPVTEPAQFLPKTVQVEQFLGNAASLPVSMPAPGAPDSLNYVPVAAPSATPAGSQVSSSTGGQLMVEASSGAVQPAVQGENRSEATDPRESSTTQGGGRGVSRAADASRNDDGLKATNVYVVTSGINLGR